MDIKVRQANPDDYENFSRVAFQVHEHHVATVPNIFRSTPVVISGDEFDKLLLGDDTDLLVAEWSHTIIGYALMEHRSTQRDILVPRTYSFIHNFGVLDTYRRLGVGRLLFASCAARAKERGAQSLELDCWEANQEAVKFYEALGMKLNRRWFSLEF